MAFQGDIPTKPGLIAKLRSLMFKLANSAKIQELKKNALQKIALPFAKLLLASASPILIILPPI